MRLGLTLGDPRGIGPEIVAAALRDARVQACGASFTVIGPSGTNMPVDVSIGAWPGAASAQATADAVALAGLLSGRAIEEATRQALAGAVQGIVTAPIDKAALKAGGFDYPGHTEMLAALAQVPTTMMLASDRLRVVLATTHLALRDVPKAVTREALEHALQSTHDGLTQDFGIAQPRLALCALNPHAGDSGRFGNEDDTLLAPVARAFGAAGPLPDTVFVRAMLGEFDAVIAPYHDVGMTAIKVASFGHAVNVTLGLPFVRTSPDHGTALDIAGRGIANAESFVQAILLAVTMVRRRTADSR
jgi:4-hydroxythreonine-4-phosphate dehydrogenase